MVKEITNMKSVLDASTLVRSACFILRLKAESLELFSLKIGNNVAVNL